MSGPPAGSLAFRRVTGRLTGKPPARPRPAAEVACRPEAPRPGREVANLNLKLLCALAACARLAPWQAGAGMDLPPQTVIFTDLLSAKAAAEKTWISDSDRMRHISYSLYFVRSWGSSVNDGTTQTARDPPLKGGRFAPICEELHRTGIGGHQFETRLYE